MPSAFIYMEHPVTGEPLTLGKLTLHHNKPGEFTYTPNVIEDNVWVPDPIHYPLTAQTYIVTKNQGIPGFIDDAIPDGWGERLLQCTQEDPVSRFDLLIRSPNNDRAGNLMTGLDEQPLPGAGQDSLPDLAGLDAFIEACDAIYAPVNEEDRLKKFGLSSQLSSLGGARPKRTFVSEQSLLLAKPPDRFDQYHVAPLEHACMTFAANKGMRVAKTALFEDLMGTTLLVERFDRQWKEGIFRRLPLLSGLTLLNTEWHIADRDARSYAHLSDQLHRREVPQQDRQELYLRMIYNALVGNADDHPRNHAIIYIEGSWRLSPMYDAVPLLDEGPAKQLSMSVGLDGARISRSNLLSQHRQFALARSEAEDMLEMVASWVEELRDYYGEFLEGEALQLAREATSASRILS
jgi:serine/threonine-protein kinase HipA